MGPSGTVRSGLAWECVAVIVRLGARQKSWYGSGGLKTLAVRRQRLCTRKLAKRACIEVRKMRSITLCRFLRLRFLDLSAPWRAEGSARQEDGHEARDGAESKEQLEARLEQLLLASTATNPAVTSAKSLPPTSATAGTAHQRFLGDDPTVVWHTRPRTAGHQRISAHASQSSPSAARAARARLLYSIAQV